jgi:magnesium-transporting ATPase (P-type)
MDNVFMDMQVRLVVKFYVKGAPFRPERQDHIEKWKGQNIMKWRETTSKNLAIVSTLVATVAFSAAFNVPGSYGSDGKANLSGDHLYNAFLVLDTIAVTTSVVATILLIYGRASRSHRSWIGFMISMHFLWLALNSMMLAFFAAIVAVMSKKNPMKIALSQLIYYGLYILMTLLASLATPGSLAGVMRFLVGGCYEQQRRAKRRISRQFPFVMFYAFNVVVFIAVNTVSLAAIDVSGRLTW